MPRLRDLSTNAAMFAIGGMAFAVLTTGTAVAVTTSAVSITDPATGAKAHVTQKQSLASSQRDPYNGVYQRVNASGAAAVDVLPSQRWHTLFNQTLSASNAQLTLAESHIPQRIALSSLTLTATGDPGSVTVLVAAYISDSQYGDCASLTGATFGTVERFPVLVATGTTQHLTWPSPLVWSDFGQPGHKLCVNLQGSSGPAGWSVAVSANGFYV
jgi:hypothetical protein